MIHLALLIVSFYVIAHAVLVLLRIIGAILGAGSRVLDARFIEAEHREYRKRIDIINAGGPHPDWDYARCYTDPEYRQYVETYMQRQKPLWIPNPDKPGSNMLVQGKDQ